MNSLWHASHSGTHMTLLFRLCDSGRVKIWCRCTATEMQVYLQKLRVKELHAILRSLGLSTQGLKHQLVSKIEGYLHDNADGSARAVKNRREASAHF